MSLFMSCKGEAFFQPILCYASGCNRKRSILGTITVAEKRKKHIGNVGKFPLLGCNASSSS